NQNWDLVAERAPAEAAEPPAWTARLDALLDELAGACDERAHCLDDTDPLHALLCEYAAWADQVRAVDDEHARLALLGADGGRPTLRANGKGAKHRWAPDHDLPDLRRRVDDIAERCEALRMEVAHAAVTRLAVELRRFTLEAAAERRAAGQLE